ncbi:MAG: hypothetical protein RI988_3440 [Pseudomonadota bacterium]|jgi:hypothetical protein
MYDLSLREQTEQAKIAIQEALSLFNGAQPSPQSPAPPDQAPRQPMPSPIGPPPPSAPPAPGPGDSGQAQGTPSPFAGAASNPELRQQQGSMGSLGAALGQSPVKAGGPLMPGYARGGLVTRR